MRSRIISLAKPPSKKQVRKEKRNIWKTHKKLAPKFREGKALSKKQVLMGTKKGYQQDRRIKR